MRYAFSVFLILLSISSRSFAEDNCEAIFVISESVMGIRQTGAPMPEAIKISEETDDKDIAALFKELVIIAYREPQHPSKRLQEQATQDFANRIYTQCLKAKNE
jgi:hypothetical protein